MVALFGPMSCRFLRGRHIKWIAFAEAADAADSVSALLVGGEAAIAAAVSAVSGTPRVINLSVRRCCKAEHSEKRQHEDRFY